MNLPMSHKAILSTEATEAAEIQGTGGYGHGRTRLVYFAMKLDDCKFKQINRALVSYITEYVSLIRPIHICT